MWKASLKFGISPDDLGFPLKLQEKTGDGRPDTYKQCHYQCSLHGEIIFSGRLGLFSLSKKFSLAGVPKDYNGQNQLKWIDI